MIKILDVPLDQDLSELSRELWARRISHQIRHEKDHQEIWLADPAYFPEVLQMIRDWQQGDLAMTQVPVSRANSLTSLLFGWHQWPVTLLLILSSILITAGIHLESQGNILTYMTFVPVGLQGNQLISGNLMDVIQTGELWRLITPMFLHFGWLHLVFNCLWVWELGRLIEQEQKSRSLIAVVILSALVANVSQYLTGSVLFGGLSGVLYALLGYCWLWDRLARIPIFHVRKGVVIALMIWLVFCLTGGVSMLGLGNVANAAHIGGLVAGLLMAFVRIRLLGEGKPSARVL